MRSRWYCLSLLIALVSARAARAQPAASCTNCGNDAYCSRLFEIATCTPATEACHCMTAAGRTVCFADATNCSEFFTTCVKVAKTQCVAQGNGPVAVDPKERARQEHEREERERQAREAAQQNAAHVQDHRDREAAADNQGGNYLQGALVNGISSWTELKTTPQWISSPRAQAQRMYVEWLDFDKWRTYLKKLFPDDNTQKLTLSKPVADKTLRNANASATGGELSSFPPPPPQPTPLPPVQTVHYCDKCGENTLCKLNCVAQPYGPWNDKRDPTEVTP
jgi:hypothetical protein